MNSITRPVVYLVEKWARNPVVAVSNTIGSRNKKEKEIKHGGKNHCEFNIKIS